MAHSRQPLVFAAPNESAMLALLLLLIALVGAANADACYSGCGTGCTCLLELCAVALRVWRG